MKLDSQSDLEHVADLTPGYVGADLNLLRHETAYLSQVFKLYELKNHKKFIVISTNL